jgi:hypothetical protein
LTPRNISSITRKLNNYEKEYKHKLARHHLPH